MSQSGLTLDPAVFDPASISAETKAINAGILKALSGLPDMWTFPPQVIRDRRAQGLGPFPVVEPAENARVTEIEGRGGPIPLRIIAPLARDSRGVYLHIHGGGWVVGAARENDPRLQRIAENTGLTVSTINTYMKRIFAKLGVHSRVELVARMAGTEGLGSTMSTAYSATDGDFAQA